MSAYDSTFPSVASQEFQYARFIAELNAAINFTPAQLADVASSMDVTVEEVQFVFDQAEAVFEHGKSTLFCGESRATIAYGKYVWKWDGGEVETNCVVNLDMLTVIDVSENDDCDFFEEMERGYREHIELTLNGVIYEFEAYDGELTEKGQNDLQAALTN